MYQIDVPQFDFFFLEGLEASWADFGSDSPLLIIVGVFLIRGWSELIIWPNNAVVWGVCGHDLKVISWIRASSISNRKKHVTTENRLRIITKCVVLLLARHNVSLYLLSPMFLKSVKIGKSCSVHQVIAVQFSHRLHLINFPRPQYTQQHFFFIIISEKLVIIYWNYLWYIMNKGLY